MDERVVIRAIMAPWYRGVQFLIKQGRATAEPIVMKERNEGEIRSPSFELQYEDAQTLMDDLWQAGLRPTEGSGSAGALAATQRHLEDMRTLVFSKER
jgi:hypothetical protein